MFISITVQAPLPIAVSCRGSHYHTHIYTHRIRVIESNNYNKCITHYVIICKRTEIRRLVDDLTTAQQRHHARFDVGRVVLGRGEKADIGPRVKFNYYSSYYYYRITVYTELTYL